MTAPTYTPVGDGYLWSCDLCGATVATGNLSLHIEWHTRHAHAIVLDLEDPIYHGQTLPDALSEYDHVHSTTGVCVKNAHGPMCPTPPGDGDMSDPSRTV